MSKLCPAFTWMTLARALPQTKRPDQCTRGRRTRADRRLADIVTEAQRTPTQLQNEQARRSAPNQPRRPSPCPPCDPRHRQAAGNQPAPRADESSARRPANMRKPRGKPSSHRSMARTACKSHLSDRVNLQHDLLAELTTDERNLGSHARQARRGEQDASRHHPKHPAGPGQSPIRPGAERDLKDLFSLQIDVAGQSRPRQGRPRRHQQGAIDSRAGRLSSTPSRCCGTLPHFPAAARAWSRRERTRSSAPVRLTCALISAPRSGAILDPCLPLRHPDRHASIWIRERHPR